MAQKIVAGNWKMNLQFEEGEALVNEILRGSRASDVAVMVFPTSLYVQSLSEQANGEITVGVQNFNANEKGAFTGEMSISQVESVGASIGLIGHSERRAIFHETDADLKLKVDTAVEKGFKFIFCCGEPLELREAGKEFNFVKTQLEASLFHLSADQLENGIIAYEPVWAIGTGKTASSQQAEEMHAEIRSWITERYSAQIADSVSILYGGSCNNKNAKELFACPNVDGGLIGGAALKAESFLEIINAF
ncbi:MAG: triose-phosphate isomerase [Crocinitomicaceae bacterium]|nr:triose-phosphate isomerase [Crocinitomicaceae bacterium]